MSIKVSLPRAFAALACAALAVAAVAPLGAGRAALARPAPSCWADQPGQDPGQAQTLARTLEDNILRDLNAAFGGAFPRADLPAPPGDDQNADPAAEIPPCEVTPSTAPVPPGDASVTGVTGVTGSTTSVSSTTSVGQLPSLGTSTGTDQRGAHSSFRLCNPSDSQTERAIEQFIAGRSYSATLVSRSDDGCPNLTIRVSPQSPAVLSSNRQSTNLSVSPGSPGVGRISVQIISENGLTRARIGSGT